jgi:hypothetical protein
MRRPINHTYFHLLKKLGDTEALSLKKQFCLAFLRWGTKMKLEDLILFVELATEWRKAEGKVGGPRTLLERRARRLIPHALKLKNKKKGQEAVAETGRKTRDEGRGVHSPEQRAKRLEANREMVRKRMESGVVPAHWWIVYPPDDAPPLKIYNLNAFCKEHGLVRKSLTKTATCPVGKGLHRGWRVEKWSPLWDRVSGDYLPETEEEWTKGAPPDGTEWPLRL